MDEQELLLRARARLRVKQAQPQPQPVDEGGDTVLGAVAEFGKGAVRGIGSLAEFMSGGQQMALRSPGALLRAAGAEKAADIVDVPANLTKRLQDAISSAAAPVARAVAAKPAGAIEKFAATAGETAGPALIGGGGVVPALASGVGAAVGERLAGEPGKIAGAILSPGGMAAAVKLAKIAGHATADMLRIGGVFGDEGLKTILARYQSGLIGKEGLVEIVKRTAKAEELVPGTKPSVGMVVADAPAGTALTAFEKMMRKTSVGEPAANWVRQVKGREAAIEQFKKTTEAAAAPLRKQAIAGAAEQGVQAKGITRKIARMLDEPIVQGTPLAQRALRNVRKQINSAADKSGAVHPEALWAIRNGVGNTIRGLMRGQESMPKAVTGKLERQVQLRIDAAIRASGGGGQWNQWLRDYRQAYGKIRAEEARFETFQKPPIKTQIGGGVKMGEEQRMHIPQMLWRPGLVANYVLKIMANRVEPEIDRIATELLRDPKKFSELLRQYKNYDTRMMVANTILNRGVGRTTAIAAGAVQSPDEYGRQIERVGEALR